MADEDTQQTEGGERDADETKGEHASEEQQKAHEAEDKHETAKETMKELEESDEPPTNLEDWPDDEAKYVTYGGAEGDHSYDEGPEAKLGPSSLERREDGSVAIEGEEVDDPDEHKADPIPGGPTDPDAAELPGEKKQREKREAKHEREDGESGGGEGDEGDEG
jgi:hypothetical protein